jgi:hypothetical protein
MYQLTQHDSILRLTDGASIPADPVNSDYAAYQDWIAAGNTPLPYAPPPPPPVLEVSMAQARKALILSGFDLAKVESVFLSLPQPAQALARVDWEFAATVHRDNPLVAAVQTAEKWTDAQVDAMFTLAATL